MKVSSKTTNIIGLKEFRQNADSFIKRISKGESFTVLKRTKPVFKISPVDSEDMWETVVDFTEVSPEGLSAEEFIKALRKNNG